MQKREFPRAAIIGLSALFCAAPAVSAVLWFMDLKTTASTSGPGLPHDDPAAQPQAIVINDYLGELIDSGEKIVARYFEGTVRDPRSLQEMRALIQGRGERALSALHKELEQLPDKRSVQAARLHQSIATLLIRAGNMEGADASLQKILEIADARELGRLKSELLAMRGVAALRRGEIENCIVCVGPSSCIFPIDREAIHTNTAGSREAIAHFTAYLRDVPGDLRVRWLLNLAYMTLGEYPDGVPRHFLVPLDTFRSTLEGGRFENVALRVGLTSRGPNLAGGAIFDDFTGDNLPDLFTTSLDDDRGASLYVNRGDGTFEDRSQAAGLRDQICALNVTRADFDNDGYLDVLLLRGGWQEPMRLSLLRNNGRGGFEDVTVASGLVTSSMTSPIATESAAWGDYDNDGFVDVFVCGEFKSPSDPQSVGADPRNRCRLYRNQGNGTFANVAAAAGVENEECAKGCAWGDYDGDGGLDLFVSNMYGPCRLYRNQKDGTFRDVAAELSVTGPQRSFACWFFDYDNDGRLDLYVNDFSVQLAEIVAVAMGLPLERSSRPRLYRNLGSEGFRDVSREVGLDRPMAAMGCNFGDIDNDGYLDIYLGTGKMTFENLVPNLLFKSMAGRRFEDITMPSGTGHLQKGHGVSFADWDCDGDLDLFVEAGGGVPGDKSYNLLFQNPGHGRHWLKVKLVGTITNRALGARIKALVKAPDGSTRSIYRTVGNNSSFGGNSLVELIGLSDATSVAEVEVFWPTSRTTQTFRDVAADQTIVISEGAGSFQRLSQSPISLPRTQPSSRTGR